MSIDSRIQLTVEMKKHLSDCRDRTGWGGSALFNAYLADHELAKSRRLSAAMINNWLYGRTKFVEVDVFNVVVAAFESIPRERWGNAKGRSVNKSRTALTPEIVAMIQEIRQTYPLLALRMKLSESGLKGLTAEKIALLANGKQKSIMTSHLNYLATMLEKPKACE